MESLPRRPSHKKSAGDHIEGKLNVDDMPEQPEGREQGEPVDRPEHADAHNPPHSWEKLVRITGSSFADELLA